MIKGFHCLLIIVAVLPGLALVYKKDHPVNKVEVTEIYRYRSLRAIDCMPFAYVPEDYLKSPIGKKEGIGQIDFPISTNAAQAQLFYNQGMAFLYSFEYVQAARSFYRGVSYDSTAPMLYWALSQAYDNLRDSTESRNMAAKALSLSMHSTKREQQFIQLQYAMVQPADDSIAVELQREKVAALMDSANAWFAGDPEMWLYTGIVRALEDFKGPEGETYAQKCRQAIDHYFSKALHIQPTHFGAWHYLVHFHEATSEFTKALQYGKQYTGAAPAIAHAWHMYAHDLMKTGQVSEAIKKFNDAFQLEEKKYAAENMPRHYDWHHQHNMELLAYCYQYKGQFEKATAIFSKLDTLKAFVTEMEGRIRKGHPYFYLQNNQPLQAIRLATPLMQSDKPSNQFMGYFIKGLANVFQKDIAGANESYARVIYIIDSLKNSSIARGTRVADAEIQYSYMYAQAGIIEMGTGLLKNSYDSNFVKKMNAIQATLLKQTGPDPWIDALYFLQLLTQMSINMGNLALAESSANNMLLHDPKYPGSYWLLAKIKKLQKEEGLAKTYLEKARLGYKDADQAFLAQLHL